MIEIFEKENIETLGENALQAKYGIFNPLFIVGNGRTIEFIDKDSGDVVSVYKLDENLKGFRQISNSISKHLDDNFVASKIYKVGESIQGISQHYEGGQVVVNDQGINVLIAMPNICSKERRAFKNGLLKVHVGIFNHNLPIISFRTDNIFFFDTEIMLESVYGNGTISKDFNTQRDFLTSNRVVLQKNLEERKITFYFSDSQKNEVVAVRKGILSQKYVNNCMAIIHQEGDLEKLIHDLLYYHVLNDAVTTLRNHGEFI
ncbi:hypothetical protein ACYSNU_07185 [Enterococcus sp. LJL120]